MKQILFFKGSTCVPCKILEPMLDSIVEGKDVQVVKAVDDIDWMMNFGIRQVPAVVVIDGDKEPTILVGKEVTKAKLVELL